LWKEPARTRHPPVSRDPYQPMLGGFQSPVPTLRFSAAFRFLEATGP
jgi:hypothetical protein